MSSTENPVINRLPKRKFNDDLTNLLQFSSKKNVPLVMQDEMGECGLACIAMIASYYGNKLDMAAIRSRLSIDLNGMNLQQIIEVSDGLNMSSRPLKCQLEDVEKLSLPCIIHWDLNHFVVLTGASRNRFTVNDPSLGKRIYSASEFSEHFTGIALELIPTEKFKKVDERNKMRFYQLWSSISGHVSSVISLIVLSIILQFFALMTPYYIQLVIDQAVLSSDQPLLIVLAIGFAFLVLVNVFTTGVRSWLVLRISSALNLQMGANLLRHLLRLPLSYFEKRHIGDLVSRFGSLNKIRERLSTGIVETCVDGLMSIIILLMMFLYSVKLTLVVVIAVGLYALLRVCLFFSLRHATSSSIQASAQEQSNFLENIRAIQAIKLFTNEAHRQSLWQNRFADVINAEIKVGKLKITFDLAKRLIFGMEYILVVYFAAVMIMSSSMTTGVMLAFIAYKTMFIERVTNLIEQLILFSLMRLHLNRISDIALHDQEQFLEGTISTNIQGTLTLENVSFKYQDTDTYVFKNISLQVIAGETLAITGPSGCGKSTLLKVMLGLLQPTEGKVLLDGHDITHIGLTNYRKLISAVMQNDTLLSGSIADNITFSSPEPNYHLMKKCSISAAIAYDISKLPMRYNTLVGDMGSQFSGGQVQRILLARALYREPKILFLDEATSNLDSRSEFKIASQIKILEMTRVIIAHRKETIESADKIFHFDFSDSTFKQVV
ncbi:MAG: ATP-binding cassette subfamily B protein RaxB [Cocleimonas sp.]|jgi:ATP-binding cassette subfamily B protein RaxB